METTDSKAVATRVVITGDESPESPTASRLDSWKDIAHYLNRSVRTVQRGKCWRACRSIDTVMVLEARSIRTSQRSMPGPRAGVKRNGRLFRLRRSHVCQRG